MNELEPKNQLDLLRHLEWLTEEINRIVGKRGRSAFRKYPMTFALLVLFGAIAVNEGVKGILKDIGILETNPFFVLVFGLAILVFTGTLYKKLDK